MPKGVNKVILVANLGNDPEVKYLPSGGAVTNISVATTDTWKNKETGAQESRTEWHKVCFFNRLAEIAGEYLKTGSQVYIEGSLRTRNYDKDGVKIYTTEIVGSELQMLGGRSGADSSTTPTRQPSQAPQKQRSNVAPQPAQGIDEFEDDIPF